MDRPENLRLVGYQASGGKRYLHDSKTLENSKEIRACGLAVEYPNIHTSGRAEPMEVDIPSSGNGINLDMSLIHNCFSPQRVIMR